MMSMLIVKTHNHRLRCVPDQNADWNLSSISTVTDVKDYCQGFVVMQLKSFNNSEGNVGNAIF